MRLSFALFLHPMLMNELFVGEALMDLCDKPFTLPRRDELIFASLLKTLRLYSAQE